MATRRRKRRRRFRITRRGYAVLGILILIPLAFLGLRIAWVYFTMEREDGGKEGTNATSAMAAPEAAAATPQATAAPVFSPAPTPTSAPALATTGARLPTADEEKGAVQGVVRTSNVAMRKGPGKDFDLVHKYNIGEEVLVYALENGYTFVKVLSDERIGFISSDFVVKFALLPGEADATPVPAALAGTVMGLVNVDELKLRSVPSTHNNTPLGVCKRGDLLWIYMQAESFYYVEVAATGQRGYVFAEYVMPQQPVPTGTPVPRA